MHLFQFTSYDSPKVKFTFPHIILNLPQFLIALTIDHNEHFIFTKCLLIRHMFSWKYLYHANGTQCGVLKI